METNKAFVFFILLFFLKTIDSKCTIKKKDPLDFNNNPPLLSCQFDIDKVLFYPDVWEYGNNVQLTASSLPKLIYQDSLYISFPTPVVYKLLQPVETYGGNKNFTGFFFIQSSPTTPDNCTWSIEVPDNIFNQLTRIYIPETEQLIFSYYVPEGSCSFDFLNNSYPYQNASIGNPKYTLNSQGDLKINGNNLKNINIRIKDQLKGNSSDIDDYKLNRHHTTETFNQYYFKYCGNWSVSISQCSKIINQFSIETLPEIKSNQIKSNQIKSNQIKSNQIKSNQIKSNHIHA